MQLTQISDFLLKKIAFLALAGLSLWAVPNAAFGGCNPDISVTKVVDVATAFVGDTVNYTITVEELSDCDADNVTLTDTLPTEVTFVPPLTGTDAGDCSEAGGVVTCDFGTLAAATRTFAVQAQVNGGEGTTVTNTTTVATTTTPEDIPGNNQSSASFQVLAPTPTPIPIPTPTPVPPLNPPLIEGSGCSLHLGAHASPFSFYGMGSALLAALWVLRAKNQK